MLFSFQRLRWIFLLVAAASLAGCNSEKSRLGQLISSEIRGMPLKVLPAGSSVKNVSATVTAQSGLEFTGKAEVGVALPKLYFPIEPTAAISNELRSGLRENFRAAILAGSPEMPIPEGKFDEFLEEVIKSLTPGFIEAVPAGYDIRFTYPSIDGRRSGDSVRFERVEDPEIDWGDKISNIGGTFDKLTADAKVYAAPEDFFDSVQKAFTSQLTANATAIRAQISNAITAKNKALAGVWEGRAIEQMVDRSQFQLKISFSSSGDCSGKLSEESVISGIGISEIKEDLDFQGTWKLTDTGLEVTATQKRWFHQGKQLQGPGSDKPGSAREESLSPDPFTMKFSLPEGGEQLTWVPVGTNIESASGKKIIAIMPISLSKTQEEEAPTKPEPTQAKKAPIKLKPMMIDEGQALPTSGEIQAGSPTQIEEKATASPTDSDGEVASTAKIIKAPDLDDFPTFTPSTPSAPPATEGKTLPPTPMTGERFPDTRLKLLTESDIQGWSTDEIRYALNEMYARYGLTFKDKAIQKHFVQFQWYHARPNRSSAEIEAAFSEIETANKNLLAAARAQNPPTAQKSPAGQTAGRKVKIPKVIYGPTDSLPDDIAGKGVAGDFLFVGTDMQGRPQLIAQDDRMNPFPRKFTIINDDIRDSPGVFLRVREYRPIHVQRQTPLLLMSRDSAPGIYFVRSQTGG